ncbi:AAA family ATPase [Halopseudomonas pachastrellae]|nr:AAA family ATPase [Halopseudomonas pachastrellae]
MSQHRQHSDYRDAPPPDHARLRPPPLPAELITRSVLLDQLMQHLARGRRLALLRSPPGYGKTTLMHACALQLQQDWLWVRCSSADNQPAQLYSQLAALLAVPPGNPAHQETALFNQLEARQAPLVLFIDDLHLLRSSPARQLINRLLTLATPRLQIIAACQGEPQLAITQLYRDQQLLELDTTDLTLDSQQLAALASTRHIALDNDSLYQLRTSTEGWISGVLLALSARARQANADDDTARYLNESVLDSLTRACAIFLSKPRWSAPSARHWPRT